MRYLFSLIFGLLALKISAQTQQQLDSMERLIPTKKGVEKVRLLNDLTYYYCQKDAKKAIGFGEKSLLLAQTLKDEALLASTYNDLSMPYLVNGDFPKVVVMNQKALAIRTKLKDTVGIIASESKLGNAYYELTRYKEAQHAYNHAIELARKIKADQYLMQLYINSANLLEITGYVEEALKMQLDVKRMAEKENNLPILITNYGNIGSCYGKLKQYDKARESFKKAIPLIEQTGATEQLAMVYQGLGVVERNAGNTDLGLSYYKRALAIYRKVDSKTGAGIVSVNIGNCYMEIKQLDSAEVYLLQGLDLVKNTNSYRQTMLGYKSLAELELKRKNYQKASKYLQLENQYKDSVLVHQGNDVIAEMFTRYEVEKKERELAESKVRIAENESLKAIWFGVSACLFLLIVLVVIYFRHKRKLAIHQLAQTKQEEQLLRQKQLHEQKLNISRELHDNIGSQLTYLISSLDHMIYQEMTNEQLHGKLNELIHFGRITMAELRSTVWAMNLENGTITDLVERIESLSSKIPLPVKINNEVKEVLAFKSLELLNLLRIVQEATQNTLKYANAKEIQITIRPFRKGIQLEITDNGNGLVDVHSGGSGLRSMKYRCEEIGGSFEIEGKGGKGTSVSCTLENLND
jgi:signal transduction histidine kinase